MNNNDYFVQVSIALFLILIFIVVLFVDFEPKSNCYASNSIVLCIDSTGGFEYGNDHSWRVVKTP